jgi:rRNA-processing protein FCF1
MPSPLNDIVIDDNIVPLMCNPSTDPIKQLMQWLVEKGIMTVSHALIKEYVGTAGAARADNPWPRIVNRLIASERWNVIDKPQLAATKFDKKQEKRFKSCIRDRDHIRLVISSSRKILISKDSDLRDDINSFKGIPMLAVDCPSKAPLT